jgi:hypothetical protein
MTTYRYNADSWDEFVHDLRTREPNWVQSSIRQESGEWSGTRTWEEALEYAINGHPAARVAMDAVTLKVTADPEPQWDSAPVGAFPCIPAYAAGAPEDMFTQSEDAPPVSRPIVRITVNMMISAAIDASHIRNRGAAIVTLIDRIQLSGRRVELVASMHSIRGNNRYMWNVTVKRPEEPIDMDRIGLSFATPMMYRRFFFRVMEFSTPEYVSGYGTPDNFEDDLKDSHLSLPSILSTTYENEYSTPERAAAHIAKLWKAAAA